MMRWMSRFAQAWTVVFLLALLGGWSPGVYAAGLQRSAVSGSMTLSITNGATFQYDDFPGPRFHLVLTLSAPWSGPNTLFTGQIQLDNGQQLVANFAGPASDGVTYTADASGDRDNSGNLFAIGAHTATATLTNPAASPSITSNQVSFTITKRWMTFSCGLGSLFVPGQAEQVILSAQGLDSSIPLNWTQGTATVWLVGPTTVTYANLQPDSSGAINITTPTQTGWYALNCSFTGTAYYAAQQMTSTNKDVLISKRLQLGGVQLYTNPQTVVANRTIHMLVVFKAASGQPTPTGEFNISIDGYTTYYTQSVRIGSDGSASVTLAPIPDLRDAGKITIHYFGDPTYNDQMAKFPLTNPAIPGSGGAPSQATATPSRATPSVTANSTASADSSFSSTTRRTGNGPQSQAGAPFAGAGPLALLIVFALLVLGGGGAGAWLLWRRRIASARAGAPAPHGVYPPGAYPPESASRGQTWTEPTWLQAPTRRDWPLE